MRFATVIVSTGGMGEELTDLCESRKKKIAEACYEVEERKSDSPVQPVFTN
jgi:hypothetical protein